VSSENSPLLYPLTNREIKDLKKGTVLLKHYHNVHFPEDTLAVLLGKKIDRRKYDYLILRGIDIVGQHIENETEFFDKLEKEVWMSKHDSPKGLPVYIAFLKQKFYEEITSKKTNQRGRKVSC